MLLKSDVPISHRMALVTAITLTGHASMVVGSSQLPLLELCAVIASWLWVVYTSLQRRKWRAEARNGDIRDRYNAFDRTIQPVQSWFNQASIFTHVIYWGTIILAAILIHRFVP